MKIEKSHFCKTYFLLEFFKSNIPSHKLVKNYFLKMFLDRIVLFTSSTFMNEKMNFANIIMTVLIQN